LVEHPHLYNILSEHIHTLTEDHCLQHFDAVLSGVRIILDQRLADEQRRKNEAEASKALSRIQNSTGRAK
jgi:hypothetical protein